MQLLLVQVWIPLWPHAIRVLRDHSWRRARPAQAADPPVKIRTWSPLSLYAQQVNSASQHCVTLLRCKASNTRKHHLKSAPLGCAAAYCSEPCPSACSVAVAVATVRLLLASPSPSRAAVASASLAASACSSSLANWQRAQQLWTDCMLAHPTCISSPPAPSFTPAALHRRRCSRHSPAHNDAGARWMRRRRCSLLS